MTCSRAALDFRVRLFWGTLAPWKDRLQWPACGRSISSFELDFFELLDFSRAALLHPMKGET
jgi:hypothetical protein